MQVRARYEPNAGYRGEDYWDAEGSGSCPGTREESGGDLPQSWDIGACGEMRC